MSWLSPAESKELEGVQLFMLGSGSLTSRQHDLSHRDEITEWLSRFMNSYGDGVTKIVWYTGEQYLNLIKHDPLPNLQYVPPI